MENNKPNRDVQQKPRPAKVRKKKITEKTLPTVGVPRRERSKRPITESNLQAVDVQESEEYKEVESALNKRKGWEILVSRISREFIGLTSDDMDMGIKWALHQIGESPHIGGIDRSYVFLLSDDGMTIHGTHEWCCEGIPPAFPSMDGMSISELPWLMGELNRYESVKVEFVSGLPVAAEAERRLMDARGVQTLLVVPMICRKRNLFGFLGFESLLHSKRWDKEDVALIKTISDILVSSFKRMRFEKELKRQNEFLNSTIESLGHPFYVVDANDYTIVLANSATGFGKLLAHPFWVNRTNGIGIDSEHIEPIEEVKKTGEPSRTEKHHYDENGGLRIHEIRAAPLFDSMGNVAHVIVYYLDVTEQKMLERRLMETQKMESIGKLAANIAHNFNNMLSIIGLSAESVRAKIGKEHPTQSNLADIEETIGQAGKLVRQMLNFSNPIRYETKITDINGLVRKSSRMFGVGREGITIHTDLNKDVWRVDIDGGQVEQVLLNLYMNAAEAMPEGGRLKLETKNVTLEEGLDVLEPGNYVRITISDTGGGMDEDTRQKVFEPFFTTKTENGGRGFGLSSAHGIIRNHKGHITVWSKKGLGTKFDMYLPAAKASGDDAKGERPEIG